ncbi:MAG: LysR family transcriptional regulator [Alphaproteobacteria bacterium]|nr:LysR family transcriptional regulator [Alphaproteobacteria bacterium]
MEWDKLRVFYEVAKAGSITHASKVVNISQPALSRTIQMLEHQLKAKLFERVPRGVSLTKDGKLLYEHVIRMQAEADLALKVIQGKDAEAKGKLRIATTHSISYSWLVYFLPGFLKKHPLINLSIIGEDKNHNIDDFDVGILPYQPNRPDLIQRYLTSFHMTLFASKEYLKEFGVPNKLEDLRDHQLITYGDGSPNPHGPLTWFSEDIAKSNASHKPYIQINSSHGRLNLVKLGLGITELGHDHPTFEKVDLVEVLPHLKGPTIEFYYIYSKKMIHSKRVTSLMDYLEESLNL